MTADAFVPTQEELVTDYPLAGLAFYMQPRPNDMCYVAANVFDRLDGESAPLYDPLVAKRIVAIDPGEPPYFTMDLPLDYYMVAGEEFKIRLSPFEDPEGNSVIFRPVLRKAALFANVRFK